MTGNLFLKNDGRMHFAVANADGNVRMWLYKDKGGDGVRLNNGIDGGGDFVFGKNGEFYSPSHLHAGGAIFGNNGDIYGGVWGNNWISTWASNCFAARDSNINIRATWDWVNQYFVQDFRLGSATLVSPSANGNYASLTAPPGHALTAILDRDTRRWPMPDTPDAAYARPFQKNINGNWHNVSEI